MLDEERKTPMNTATQLTNTYLTKTFSMPARAGHLFRVNLQRRLALSVFLLCAVLLARPCAAAPGEWDFTGSLNTARYSHSATLLQDGRVLVAGGYDTNLVRTNSAELYDPATGSWSVTGSLNIGRVYQSAILLPNGKVLVVGGLSAGGLELTAELYDPANGTWSFTDTPNFAGSRSMLVLPDGQVLTVTDRFAELYDPASGSWRVTGSTNERHVAGLTPIPLTLLPNGKVLYEAGLDSHAEPTKVAELYDPASETWSLTGSLNTAREQGHSTILLPSGLVLLAGGGGFGDYSSELYDPATGVWSYTGPSVAGYATGDMNLLSTGMVLMPSGMDAQLYNSGTGTWSATGSLHDDHPSSHAILLHSGMVLVEGGGSSVQQILASAELYDPGTNLPSQVSGRGSITGQGDQASFTVRASQSGDRPSGSLSFSDPAAGISIARARIRTLTFNGNSAGLGGNARLGDGTRVTYSVSVTDSSSNGRSDTFSISLSNGYTAGGTLTSGDIRIY
jgi:hypothetical protein